MVEQSPNMADAFDDAWSISKNEMSEQENDQYRECMEDLKAAVDSLYEFGESDYAEDVQRIIDQLRESFGEAKEALPRGSPYTMGLAGYMGENRR